MSFHFTSKEVFRCFTSLIFLGAFIAPRSSTGNDKSWLPNPLQRRNTSVLHGLKDQHEKMP